METKGVKLNTTLIEVLMEILVVVCLVVIITSATTANL
jgi:hypothetical protein